MCDGLRRLATCPVQIESNGPGWEAMIGHGPPELGRRGIDVGSGEAPTSKEPVVLDWNRAGLIVVSR